MVEFEPNLTVHKSHVEGGVAVLDEVALDSVSINGGALNRIRIDSSDWCDKPAPRTEPCGKVCPLCGGMGNAYGTKDGFALRECTSGHAPVLLSWQYPSVAAYEAVYTTPGVYHNQCQANEGQAVSIERDEEHRQAAIIRCKQLQMFKNCGFLLDIGAGGGAFVDVAGSVYFYKAAGLEPAQDMVRWAQARDRKVAQGGWQDIEGTWDILTCHDVFEHLTDPMGCLAAFREHLRDDGLLVIEMPLWDCRLSRKQGVEFRHIRPLQHLCLYSRDAATALFERAGFYLEAYIEPLRGTLGKATWYLSKGEA